MPKSLDTSAFPHTSPNDQAPKPGDLVYGDEGMFAVNYVTPQTCVGLLARPGYFGVVDIPLVEYATAFPHRIMVAESVKECSAPLIRH